MEWEEKHVQKFWSKVVKGDPDECWLWHGTTTGSRMKYGTLSINHRAIAAHRLSYQLNVGNIPDGMFVMHTCDVPLCVNPAHLRVGTHEDNQRDKINKGRHKYAFGEEHGNSKLSDDKVREIRLLLEQGKSQYFCAAKFNVTKQSIFRIAHGTAWKHVK